MPEKAQLIVEGKNLSVSNLNKVLYPKVGFTKGQVIDYYIRIAPVLLPHLRDRPLTMKRYPNGVDAEFFYEKNCPSHRPKWVKTAKVCSAGNDDGIRSRSRSASGHRAMRPGGTLAARFAKQNEIESVCQNERIQGSASLCAAEHADQFRPNQGFITRSRPTFGRRTRQPRYFKHVESAAQRKSVSRLESERRTQNNNLRLQFARQRRADCLHSSDLGRSGELPEKEKSRSFKVPLRQDSRPCYKNGRLLCRS